MSVSRVTDWLDATKDGESRGPGEKQRTAADSSEKAHKGNGRKREVMQHVWENHQGGSLFL